MEWVSGMHDGSTTSFLGVILTEDDVERLQGGFSAKCIFSEGSRLRETVVEVGKQIADAAGVSQEFTGALVTFEDEDAPRRVVGHILQGLVPVIVNAETAALARVRWLHSSARTTALRVVADQQAVDDELAKYTADLKTEDSHE